MELNYVLSDLEQVRALADPLRIRIIEVLRQQPMTTKQVAVALGEKPTRLYHHVDLLEQARLIRLLETRQNRGTVEKYYQPIAKNFIVDRRLFHLENAAASEAIGVLQEMVSDILLSAERELRQGIATGLVPIGDERRCELARVSFRTSEAKVSELMARIRALLAEAKEADQADGVVDYCLTLGFYPIERGNP